MNILETKDLHHDFEGLKVLSGVNLQVKQGERHAIIGPNGAGKTTLFNIIAGAFRPRSGSVFYKGSDITGFKPHRLARLGISRSFQITSTFPRLTTFENMRMAILSNHGMRFNVHRKVDKLTAVSGETHDALRRVDLDEDSNQQAGMLSYGKSRALEVALAMFTDTELALLDEPTAGMSREETVRSIDLIRQLTAGKPVIIVEHDMDVVFSLADRVTVLHYGSILASGSPKEVREDPRVKEAYLGHDQA